MSFSAALPCAALGPGQVAISLCPPSVPSAHHRPRKIPPPPAAMRCSTLPAAARLLLPATLESRRCNGGHKPPRRPRPRPRQRWGPRPHGEPHNPCRRLAPDSRAPACLHAGFPPARSPVPSGRQNTNTRTIPHEARGTRTLPILHPETCIFREHAQHQEHCFRTFYWIAAFLAFQTRSMARERSKAGTPRRRQRRARTKTREITDIYVLASLELHNAWQVCMVQKLSTFAPLKRGLDTDFRLNFTSRTPSLWRGDAGAQRAGAGARHDSHGERGRMRRLCPRHSAAAPGRCGVGQSRPADGGSRAVRRARRHAALPPPRGGASAGLPGGSVVPADWRRPR